MQDTLATLHTIVQGATVELFHSYGVAVAPVARHELRRDCVAHRDLCAAIGFTAPGFTGEITIGVPSEVLALAWAGAGGPDVRDSVRELANQLCGRIKSRLLQFQLSLQLGIPMSVTREGFDRHLRRGPFFAAYSFRTLRGDVVVTISGDIRHEVLVYAGAGDNAREGDVILF